MVVMNVREVVENAIEKSQKLKTGIILGRWVEVVDKLSTKSQPLYIKNDELYVAVEDSLYLHHMSMNKNKYLERVHIILKSNFIKDIRFKVSGIKNYDYSEFLEPIQLVKDIDITINEEKLKLLRSEFKDELNSNEYDIETRFKEKFEIGEPHETLENNGGKKFKIENINRYQSLDEKIEHLKTKAKYREEYLKLQGYKRCKKCETMFLGGGTICKLCSLKD